MANGNSQTHHTFSRHVAPFAPLVLALLMSRAVLPSGEEAPETTGEVTAAKCDDAVDNFQACHERFPTGCSQAGKYDAYLNLLKNQLIDPSSTQPVGFLALQGFEAKDTAAPDGLKKGHHMDFKDDLAKLGEGQTFAAVGFLYYAFPSGVESSNCQLPNDDEEGTNVDYHIGIGFDKDTAKQLRDHPELVKNKKSIPKRLQQASVVVEMTPHFRFHFESGIWNIDNLQKAIGRQVRVVGQLILDSEHYTSGQDCAIATKAAERKSCWRASAWELHPVERFQVCNRSTNDCAPEESTDWIELDSL